MPAIRKIPDSENFSALDKLVGAWFHQDYELGGSTLEEIIANYRASSYDSDVEKTRADILRFVAEYGDTDAHLAEAFEKVFSPGIISEGWEGLTTREWLLKIAHLLE